MHDPRERPHDAPDTVAGSAPDDAFDGCHGLDAFAARVAGPLRDAEPADPMLRARVLATIRADHATGGAPSQGAVAAARTAAARPAHTAHTARAAWWRRSFTLRLTPVSGLALAAGIAAFALVGAEVLRDARPGTAPAEIAGAAPSAARTDTVHVVRFILAAPHARSVSLVGDFNAWDRTAVHLAHDGSGAWTATVALPPGRHEYAFLVDGEHWVPDPNATATMEDEFGVQSSVLVVDAAGMASAGRT